MKKENESTGLPLSGSPVCNEVRFVVPLSTPGYDCHDQDARDHDSTYFTASISLYAILVYIGIFSILFGLIRIRLEHIDELGELLIIQLVNEQYSLHGLSFCGLFELRDVEVRYTADQYDQHNRDRYDEDTKHLDVVVVHSWFPFYNGGSARHTHSLDLPCAEGVLVHGLFKLPPQVNNLDTLFSSIGRCRHYQSIIMLR